MRTRMYRGARMISAIIPTSLKKPGLSFKTFLLALLQPSTALSGCQPTNHVEEDGRRVKAIKREEDGIVRTCSCTVLSRGPF